MLNRKAWLSLTACVLAISGCSSAGKVVRPAECPILAPVSPSLMQEPTTEAAVRAELFAPLPSATPKSADSKLK